MAIMYYCIIGLVALILISPAQCNTWRSGLLPNKATCTFELVGVPGSKLYAHGSMGADNLQRPVYINTNSESESEWILESIDNNENFRMLNARYNEYFGSWVPWSSGDMSLTASSSSLYTQYDSWYIWNFETNGQHVRLKHVETGTYLTNQVGYPSRVAVLDKRSSGDWWNMVCTG